jgi:hypothetical protein
VAARRRTPISFSGHFFQVQGSRSQSCYTCLICSHSYSVFERTLRIIPLPPTAMRYERLVNRFHEVNELFDGSLNVLHNSVLSTDVSTKEVYTYSQVMKQDDFADFLEAMSVEIEAREKRGHWMMVKRSLIPPGVKTIRGIWSFKRKQFPDGRINKHKNGRKLMGDIFTISG